MKRQYQTTYGIFEWDTDKAANNLQKHGISFELATQVFTDRHASLTYDIEHSIEEDRYSLIGTVGNAILIQVIFTEQNTIRIISARKADRKEQKRYARFY